MTLGKIIKQYREQRGLSQRQFAQRCNLSNVAIARIENGFRADGKDVAPKWGTIQKIARAMGMTGEALVSKCEDFNIDISDSLEETPLVKQFIEDVSKRSPDEEMLLQAYRMIPQEHRIEAMQTVLAIKMKYEN